jgi:prenyl protein peptidase
MGVPQFWGRIGQFAPHPTHITPDVAQNGRDESTEGTSKVGSGGDSEGAQEEKARALREAEPQNLGDAWTVTYYVLLVGGAYGFYKLLFPWTASGNALAAI